MKKMLAVVLLALTASCTWIKVSEAGRSVSVSTPEAVTRCESLGRITSISRASIVGIDRNREKLSKELETIARNEAGSMGGNTVVPLAPIEGNEQKFGVYRCSS